MGELWAVRVGCAWQKNHLTRACEVQMFLMILNLQAPVICPWRRAAVLHRGSPGAVVCRPWIWAACP